MHPFVIAAGSYTAVNSAFAAFLFITGWQDEVYEWLEKHWYVGVALTVIYFTMYMILVDAGQKAAQIEYNDRFKGTRRRRKS